VKKVCLIFVLLLLAWPAEAVRAKKGCEGVSRANTPNAPRLKKGCKAVYRPNLLYRLTFNNTAPFGTDENASGTNDCTTHGADATDTSKHRCELSSASCPGNPEGDGCMQYNNSAGKTETDWFAKWTGVADTWVELHVLFYDFSNGNPRTLDFRNGSSGTGIGTLGYNLTYIDASTNRIDVSCDSLSVQWSSAFVKNTWYQWLIHVNTDDGLIEIFVDGSPTAAVSCDGAGGDSATPFDGFLVQSQNAVLLTRLDDIRVYDGDPR